MERFVAGDVVVISFPFTDFTSSRKRPALVLSNLEGNDLVVSEITSKFRDDSYKVSLKNPDLEYGRLKSESFIGPNRIFTI